MNGETQNRAPRRFAKRRGAAAPRRSSMNILTHLSFISTSPNTQSRKLTIGMLA
jgi:hypothetical protein